MEYREYGVLNIKTGHGALNMEYRIDIIDYGQTYDDPEWPSAEMRESIERERERESIVVPISNFIFIH